MNEPDGGDLTANKQETRGGGTLNLCDCGVKANVASLFLAHNLTIKSVFFFVLYFLKAKIFIYFYCTFTPEPSLVQTTVCCPGELYESNLPCAT